MNVTTQQLAELLIGIARAQQAIIDAVEAQRTGFKSTYLSPALDAVAKIRSTNRTPTLQEFPARVLSQCQSRNGPNIEHVVRDLEALLSAQTTAGVAVAPVSTRAAPAGDANDLDMTKP